MIVQLSLLVLALSFLVPCLVLAVECLSALRRASALPASAADEDMAIAILMPACNEALGISETLASLMPHLGSQDKLIVIADNQGYFILDGLGKYNESR